MLHGARISLLIGSVRHGGVGASSATTLGLLAGYFGGRIDMTNHLPHHRRLALPVVLVALAVVATIGGSLWVVILVLGC